MPNQEKYCSTMSSDRTARCLYALAQSSFTIRQQRPARSRTSSHFLVDDIVVGNSLDRIPSFTHAPLGADKFSWLKRPRGEAGHYPFRYGVCNLLWEIKCTGCVRADRRESGCPSTLNIRPISKVSAHEL
jgi:hypothetical protein